MRELKVGDAFLTTKEMVVDVPNRPRHTKDKGYGSFCMVTYESYHIPAGSTVKFVGVRQDEGWSHRDEVWDVTLPGRKRRKFKGEILRNWRQFKLVPVAIDAAAGVRV